MPETASPTSRCTTCGTEGGSEDFYKYKGSTECRPCKRKRSYQNRQLVAQKVELADRLLDIVEGWLCAPASPVNSKGPDSDCTAARPL